MTTNFRREIGRNQPHAFPSWDSHSTTDGRLGKPMGALTAQKSCLHRIKFGELWSTNSGVYGDRLATIYAPNARNSGNVRFL